eukprot:8923531-Alexandrium_andersonii.AAC.1
MLGSQCSRKGVLAGRIYGVAPRRHEAHDEGALQPAEAAVHREAAVHACYHHAPCTLSAYVEAEGMGPCRRWMSLRPE